MSQKHNNSVDLPAGSITGNFQSNSGYANGVPTESAQKNYTSIQVVTPAPDLNDAQETSIKAAILVGDPGKNPPQPAIFPGASVVFDAKVDQIDAFKITDIPPSSLPRGQTLQNIAAQVNKKYGQNWVMVVDNSSLAIQSNILKGAFDPKGIRATGDTSTGIPHLSDFLGVLQAAKNSSIPSTATPVVPNAASIINPDVIIPATEDQADKVVGGLRKMEKGNSLGALEVVREADGSATIRVHDQSGAKSLEIANHIAGGNWTDAPLFDTRDNNAPTQEKIKSFVHHEGTFTTLNVTSFLKDGEFDPHKAAMLLGPEFVNEPPAPNPPAPPTPPAPTPADDAKIRAALSGYSDALVREGKPALTTDQINAVVSRELEYEYDPKNPAYSAKAREQWLDNIEAATKATHDGKHGAADHALKDAVYANVISLANDKVDVSKRHGTNFDQEASRLRALEAELEKAHTPKKKAHIEHEIARETKKIEHDKSSADRNATPVGRDVFVALREDGSVGGFVEGPSSVKPPVATPPKDVKPTPAADIVSVKFNDTQDASTVRQLNDIVSKGNSTSSTSVTIGADVANGMLTMINDIAPQKTDQSTRNSNTLTSDVTISVTAQEKTAVQDLNTAFAKSSDGKLSLKQSDLSELAELRKSLLSAGMSGASNANPTHNLAPINTGTAVTPVSPQNLLQ